MDVYHLQPIRTTTGNHRKDTAAHSLIYCVCLCGVQDEGHEMAVLRSNDWKTYRPSVILVEKLDSDVEEILKSDVHFFLVGQGYRFFAKTINTLIYLEKDFSVNSYE